MEIVYYCSNRNPLPMRMQLNDIKYLSAYLPAAATFLAIYYAGYLSYLTPLIMFVLIPLLEIFFTGTTSNFTKDEEKERKKLRFFDYLLYLNVPIQYGLLIFYLFRISGGGLELWEMFGITMSFGMCCGILGINVAHELGHRRTWYEQAMAKALLLSTLYMQFFIEHNRGHHKNVATDQDPASSRYGETIYHFIPRSIIGGYISAWKLEQERLSKAGKSVMSWENEMIRFHVMEFALTAVIFAVFGIVGGIGFLVASMWGYFLLEAVNYIEHYGLRRKEIAPGQYEKCMPWHSWNSNHTLGRVMLYDLTRHSDHHYLAGRKYQVLRHFNDSPQMPMGYPAAIVLSLVPPLWFHIIHKEIKKLEKGGVFSAPAGNFIPQA